MENAVKMKETIDVRKEEKDEELIENIEFPATLFEKHEPWPGYVTYTSPMVNRLIEKSKARELECMQALEESRPAPRQCKASGVIQQKRRKSPKNSGKVMFKNRLSEASLSVWGAYPMVTMTSTVVPKPTLFLTDARDGPTASYNKIIFSRKRLMRVFPHTSPIGQQGETA